MSDRRRDKRFKLAEPTDGSLTVFPDIVVQEARDGEWIAISREASAVGETLVLDIVLHTDDHGAVREQFRVCVVDCQQLIVEAELRHRIRLYGDYNARILFEQQSSRRMIFASSSAAVLMREHLIRIVDISRSGCLIESRQRVEVGTVGRLRLRLGPEDCGDDVEVVRCDAVGLAQSLYHIGVRFLWTTPRQVGTIREAVTRHVEEVNASRTVWLM